MEIGETIETETWEPMRKPIPQEEPAPAPERTPTPEKVPEKVPA